MHGSGQLGEGQDKRGLGQESEAGDLPDGAGHALLLGGLEGHDEGQVVLDAAAFLQNGADVDAVPSQDRADAPEDAGSVAHHQAQVGGDDVLIRRCHPGRMPALVSEGR